MEVDMSVQRPICGVFACVLAGVVAGLGGCSMLGPGERELSASDFVGTAVVSDEPTVDPGPIPTIQVPTVTREMEAEPGAPEADADAVAVAPEAPVLIDELVGEISGKPIFVNEFLEPLSGRLRQIPVEWAKVHGGKAPTQAEWRSAATEHIWLELILLVRSELISAESYRDSKIPEQNFQRWLDYMRSSEISKFGGSAAATDRSVEERGLTTDQFLKNLQDETVLNMYKRKVAAGITISPRDIERRYKRDYEVYNPKPTVHFRWIRIDATDTEAVARVTEGLARGEPFEELARDEANTFWPERGGQQEPRPIDGKLVNAKLVQDDVLNAALVSLEPGQVAGPIERASGDTKQISWLKLESVHQVSQSLYDAQAQIERELFLEEFDRRMAQVFERQRERAGISDAQLDQIGRRLLRVAEERYMDGG
jgi:hypothetical protein